MGRGRGRCGGGGVCALWRRRGVRKAGKCEAQSTSSGQMGLQGASAHCVESVKEEMSRPHQKIAYKVMHQTSIIESFVTEVCRREKRYDRSDQEYTEAGTEWGGEERSGGLRRMLVPTI